MVCLLRHCYYDSGYIQVLDYRNIINSYKKCDRKVIHSFHIMTFINRFQSTLKSKYSYLQIKKLSCRAEVI